MGIETLAAAVGEERDTIENVYEPFLGRLTRRETRAAGAAAARLRAPGARPPPPARTRSSRSPSGAATPLRRHHQRLRHHPSEDEPAHVGEEGHARSDSSPKARNTCRTNQSPMKNPAGRWTMRMEK